MNTLVVLSTLLAVSQAAAGPFFNGYHHPYSGLYAAGAYAGLGPYGYGAPLAYNTPVLTKAYTAPVLAKSVEVAAPAVVPTVAVAPTVAAVPNVVSSQFQAQDEFGNINYGYSNINSAKHEVGNAYGGVTGGWSYVDANGKPQHVSYIADALGFRVKSTNLPVAPVFEGKAPVFDLEAPVFDGKAPEPVMDTPEVAQAKAEFKALFDAEKNREKRSTPAATERLEAVPAFPYAYSTAAAYNPYTLTGAHPYAFNGLYNHAAYAHPAAYATTYAHPAAYHTTTYAHPAPAFTTAYATPAVTAAVAAPAAREATLTTIKLNPGHAVAYRVD